MQTSWLMDGPSCADRGLRMGSNFARKSAVRGLGVLLLALSLGWAARAQAGPLVLERKGRVISLEPYAPNILRVTMSTDKAAATAAPGYGFVATPFADGWTHERDAGGDDVFRSARMVVRVAPGDRPPEKLPRPMPLDSLNRQLREPYFGGGSTEYAPHHDALLVTTADGKMLLHMRTWTMAPESVGSSASRPSRQGIQGGSHVRLARRRALLRTGAAAERLDGSARSPDWLLARLRGNWR